MVINVKIKEIIKEERPREKLIKHGAKSLSNAELIAILLRCGTKERSAIDIANEILKESDGIKGIIDLNYEDIISIKGIKEAKACLIMACFELSKRAMSNSKNDIVYDDARKIYLHIKPYLSNQKLENIMVIYLDSKLKIIKEKLYDIGGVRDIIIPKERIIRDSVINASYGVIIAHNHPSGDPMPSKQDIIMTLDLKEQLKILGILLLDHIIVAQDKYYSFSNENIV